MKKFSAKIWMSGFIAAVIVTAAALPVRAAGSVEMTADKKTVEMGEEVTVKIKTSAPSDPTEPPAVSVEFTPSQLEFLSCDTVYGGGGGGLVTFSGTEASIRFRAKTVGEAKAEASAVIDGDGANPAKASASVKITGSSGKNTSREAGLKSLSLSPGTLSPAFSPEITSYTLNVPDSVTTVAVAGEPADPEARIIAAEGFNNLEPGENEAYLTVQAKNGEQQIYQILITRSGEGQEHSVSVPEGNIPLADSSLAVSATFPNEILPLGFVKAEYDYGGQMVESAQFQMGNLVLLYLTDPETGTGDFYIYHPDTNSFQDFIQIQGIEGRFIIALSPGEDVKAPDGFTKANIQWNGKTVPGWILKGSADSGKADSDTGRVSAAEKLKGLYAGVTRAMVVHAAELEGGDESEIKALEEQMDGAAGEADGEGAPEGENAPEEGQEAAPAAADADPAAAEGEPAGGEGQEANAEPEGQEAVPTAEGGEQPAGEISASDFFLLYAMSSEGREGYYLYDMEEGTYQRYIGEGTGSSVMVGGMDLKLILVIALGVLSAILLIVVVVLALKLRNEGYDSLAEEPEEDYGRVNSRAYVKSRGGEEDMEQIRRRVIEKEKSAIKRERKALNYLVDRDDDEEDMELLQERPARRERPEQSSRPAKPAGRTRVSQEASVQSRPVKRERTETRGGEKPVRRERPDGQGRPVRTERTAGSRPRTAGQDAPEQRKRPKSQERPSRAEGSPRPASRTAARPVRNRNIDDEFEFEFLDLND